MNKHDGDASLAASENDDQSAASTPGVSLAARRNRKRKTPPLEQTLFESGFEFDFFQAVALLEDVYPDRKRVGSISAFGRQPAVRFAAHSTSMSFAASAIHEIIPATTSQPEAKMVVGFMGLTGPAGILPAHYTELIRRIEYEARGPQKHALRDWLDLFNDRLIALFYRGWKKYRPYASFRDALSRQRDSEPDRFTTVLHSAFGVGLPELSRQIEPFASDADGDAHPYSPVPVHDESQSAPSRLALIRYSGLLSQRPRSASNLRLLLEDFFELPCQVSQFHGNWVCLDSDAQSRLGMSEGNSVLAENAVVGNQAWERQNKILVRVGPVTTQKLLELLPDRVTRHPKNEYQLLSDLIRLFVGPEFDFDIQVLLPGEEKPDCQLVPENASGLRLGWNSWLPGGTTDVLLADAVFSAAT